MRSLVVALLLAVAIPAAADTLSFSMGTGSTAVSAPSATAPEAYVFAFGAAPGEFLPAVMFFPSASPQSVTITGGGDWSQVAAMFLYSSNYAVGEGFSFDGSIPSGFPEKTRLFSNGILPFDVSSVVITVYPFSFTEDSGGWKATGAGGYLFYTVDAYGPRNYSAPEPGTLALLLAGTAAALLRRLRC